MRWSQIEETMDIKANRRFMAAVGGSIRRASFKIAGRQGNDGGCGGFGEDFRGGFGVMAVTLAQGLGRRMAGSPKKAFHRRTLRYFYGPLDKQ